MAITIAQLTRQVPTITRYSSLRPAPRLCGRPTVISARARPFSAATRQREKRYTQDHEWIELAPDSKIGTIGVTTYAAKALGDVVYVELPTPSTQVSAGDTIGAVESVKSASDIMTPVAGTIVEANGALEEKPGTINRSPEGEGWIARIEVEDGKEIEKLMGKEAYDKHTGEGAGEH